MAEIFLRMMTDYSVVQQRATADSAVREKVSVLKAMLEKFSPEMNEAFWMRSASGNVSSVSSGWNEETSLSLTTLCIHIGLKDGCRPTGPEASRDELLLSSRNRASTLENEPVIDGFWVLLLAASGLRQAGVPNSSGVNDVQERIGRPAIAEQVSVQSIWFADRAFE